MFTRNQKFDGMLTGAALVLALASTAGAQVASSAAAGTVSGPAQSADVVAGSAGVGTLETNLTTIDWINLGYELAGLDGAPSFKGKGAIEPGERAKLVLAGAAPLAPAVLFVSLDVAPQPFKGGTLAPAAPLAFVMITDFEGRIELSISASANLPAGLDLVLQFAVADAGAIEGVALSNALQTATH